MTARGTAGAAAITATLLLAACGGSNGDDPTAGPSDDAARYAFATCLRKAGVQIDEQPGNGGFDIRVPDGVSKTRMARIDRDCRREAGLGSGGGKEPSPQEKARFLDKALEFARCMRAHGVPMTDPKADGHGITMGVKGSGGDPHSPVFQRAQEACKSLNPKAARGSAGGKK